MAENLRAPLFDGQAALLFVTGFPSRRFGTALPKVGIEKSKYVLLPAEGQRILTSRRWGFALQAILTPPNHRPQKRGHPGTGARLLAENISEEVERALLLAVLAVAVAIVAAVTSLVVARLLVARLRSWHLLTIGLRVGRCRDRSGLGLNTLEDLVEFSSIEPHTPALWAVVDLDSVALAHEQRGSICRAVHTPQRSQEVLEFRWVPVASQPAPAPY